MTTPLDEGNYRRRTMDVLAVMAVCSLAFSLPAIPAVLFERIPPDTLWILLVLDAAFGLSWLSAYRGAWKAVRHVPSAFIFFAALYGNLIGGMGAPGVLLYILAMILSATLQQAPVQALLFMASVGSYIVIAILHHKGTLNAFRTDQTAFLNRVLIAAAAFVGVAGTLRYLVSRLETSIQLSLDRGRQLEAANRVMERGIQERTEELRRTNDELKARNDDLARALADLNSAQENLVRSEKLAAFGTFAASLAHQLNTPLAAIRSAGVSITREIEILKSESRNEVPLAGSGDPGVIADSYSSIQRLCGIVVRGTDKAARVVEGFQSFLDRNAPRIYEAIDLRQEILEALDVYSDRFGNNLELVIDVPPGLKVLGNDQVFQQVWRNLIDNALQAMENRGVLSISAREEDGNVELSFQDNGPGIPEEIRGHVFEPFFTTKVYGEGVGLGLFIVRSILEKYGGRVSFETNPGKTIFRVRVIGAA